MENVREHAVDEVFDYVDETFFSVEALVIYQTIGFTPLIKKHLRKSQKRFQATETNWHHGLDYCCF